MLCGVFAAHFISYSFVVVVVVAVVVFVFVSVPVEKEQGWPPTPEASSALIQMILCSRTDVIRTLDFNWSHFFVQRKLQAWLIAGQAIYLNSLPFCLYLLNKNLTFCQTFLFFLW